MYTRNCPKCNKILSYSSKYNRNAAIKKNSPCKKCSAIDVSNRPEHVKMMKQNNPGKGVWKGRKHSILTKEKMSKSQKNKDYTQSIEFKEKISKATKGKNNPMHGRSFYDVWLEKYGKEEADKRLIEFKNKQSKNNKGKNNSMYGKPSPKGSGNGWSGWYNSFYFRSLHELNFILIAERFNLKLVSAENKYYSIKYIDYNGTDRTYFPDFIVNDKYLVEVKPKKLHNTPVNKLKTAAALSICKVTGLKYKLVDFGKADDDSLKELYYSNKLKLTKNYQEKFKKYFGINE